MSRWDKVSTCLTSEAEHSLTHPKPPPSGSVLHLKLVAAAAGATAHGSYARALEFLQRAGWSSDAPLFISFFTGGGVVQYLVLLVLLVGSVGLVVVVCDSYPLTGRVPLEAMLRAKHTCVFVCVFVCVCVSLCVCVCVCVFVWCVCVYVCASTHVRDSARRFYVRDGPVPSLPAYNAVYVCVYAWSTLRLRLFRLCKTSLANHTRCVECTQAV